MAQLKSTIVQGALTVTSNVVANKLIKNGGTASQILMADGSVKGIGDLITIPNISITDTGTKPIVGDITSSGHTITVSRIGLDDLGLASAYKYKGSKDKYSSLPTSDNTTGDVWNVADTGMNYAWTGTAWDALGSTIDTSGFVSATKNASVVVAGTTKDTYTYNKTTIFAPNGLIMGGSAASAGLVTRGICGVKTPDATTGACTKDNLYLNFDGGSTTTWSPTTRGVIINAGTPGTDLGSGMYQYCAVRGDIVKAWVEAKKYLTAEADTLQTVTTRGATTDKAITTAGLTTTSTLYVTGTTGHREGIRIAPYGNLSSIWWNATGTQDYATGQMWGITAYSKDFSDTNKTNTFRFRGPTSSTATSATDQMWINTAGLVTSRGGFAKSGSSNSYVLLAGGGTKAISDITGTTYGADRGISLVSGKFGHSNTAVTAVTTKGLYKISYDAYGHITGTTAITKADITGLGIPGSDTGATSIEATGDGNAVTSASYNATNRKITLTKGTTFLAGSYGSDTTKFLRNDGSWVTPPVASIPARLGASTSGNTVSPNDNHTSGWAYYQGTAGMNGLPDQVSDAEYLTLGYNNSTWAHQLLFKFNGGGITGTSYDGADLYTRIYNANSGQNKWSSWYAILTSGNYSKILDGVYTPKITSSTDNAIARFNGTSGSIQNSSITIDDSGNVVPSTTAASELGSSSKIWKRAYIKQIDLCREKGNDYGRISFYKPTMYTWFEYMSPNSTASPTGANTVQYGDVTSWARRSLIESQNGYGWVWETASNSANATVSGVMSLSSSTGNLKVKGAITSAGFKHSDSTTGTDSYVLLAGGGTKPLEEFENTATIEGDTLVLSRGVVVDTTIIL